MHMHPQDLDRAIQSAAAMVNSLRVSLKASDPVSSMVIMPMISDAARILSQLETLKSALREALETL